VIRAVIDTNVLASGFVIAGTPPDLLIRLWLAGGFVLVYSDHVVDELARTLLKPYFRSRLTPEQRASNIGLLPAFGVWTPLTVPIHAVATQPEDDLILSTAVSGRADYLVTGDGPFIRRVPTYQGIQLISPRDFLTILMEESSTH
jgi:putative PIN family toxin of toxin-antitoxin system